MRDAWRQGIMIAAGRVIQACLLWSPVWVVSVALGATDAALVGLGARLVAAVAAVIGAVRFSIRPTLVRDAAKGDWRSIEVRCSRIALFTVGLAVAAIVTLLAFGPSLVSAFFGPEFRAASYVTALMLVGTIGESLGGPVDEVLRMSGYASVVFRSQALALFVAVPAQLLAGVYGGLIALLVVYGLMFIALYSVLIGYLWRLHRILVLPKFTKRA